MKNSARPIDLLTMMLKIMKKDHSGYKNLLLRSISSRIEEVA
jgi:hypothetical protein